jgi:hypothetical protein
MLPHIGRSDDGWNARIGALPGLRSTAKLGPVDKEPFMGSASDETHQERRDRASVTFAAGYGQNKLGQLIVIDVNVW